ncbi:hypothetical protein ACLOJK_025228 [Asimina triloba]
MEPKPSSVRNLLVRILFFGVVVLFLRSVYVVNFRCDAFNGTCLLFSVTTNRAATGAPPPVPKSRAIWKTPQWRRTVEFYSSVFHHLISDGFLAPSSEALCVDTATGPEVYALREMGVPAAVGMHKKASLPLVVAGEAGHHLPFGENSFDFIFTAGGADRAASPGEFADAVCRMLRPEGHLVVHTRSADDLYSLNSFLDLFNCCRLIRSRDIAGGSDSMPAAKIREIVMKKDDNAQILNSDLGNKCAVPAHRRELVWNAEPFITEEPRKPWITLKRNIKNIKYLPSMADISFKRRYVYVDVGARSYGSSIGSWFRKQYPKQNRTFDIYAIEADRAFHDDYRSRKRVELLPYAAWVRNETLTFEIDSATKGGGMGRIRPSSSSSSKDVDIRRIQGFDFAGWLMSAVSKKDFVVMKMDVEGTEFDLIPRLLETGAICLIDELFLECHYNRWQRCCPGQRSPKYEKTYSQCLELFSSLRESGVLVHQWW